MPVIGVRCHELRLNDGATAWRIMYRLDADAVVIAEIARKTTQRTPTRVITECRRRLRQYDLVSRGET
jgi:phage-related protein